MPGRAGVDAGLAARAAARLVEGAHDVEEGLLVGLDGDRLPGRVELLGHALLAVAERAGLAAGVAAQAVLELRRPRRPRASPPASRRSPRPPGRAACHRRSSPARGRGARRRPTPGAARARCRAPMPIRKSVLALELALVQQHVQRPACRPAGRRRPPSCPRERAGKLTRLRMRLRVEHEPRRLLGGAREERPVADACPSPSRGRRRPSSRRGAASRASAARSVSGACPPRGRRRRRRSGRGIV